jgi:Tol biopolymer transport system component
MLLIEDVSDGATTLTAVDVSGESEVTLVDEEEGIGATALSADGAWAAYVLDDEDAARLILADTGTGKSVTESEQYTSIVRFGFSAQGRNLYFIAENEDGELQLYTLDAEGEREIANGLTMTAEFNASGSHLVYMTGDADDERSVTVYSMADDEHTELADGRGLDFSLLASPERILIRQIDDDELTIFSSDLDGQNVAELYSESDMTLSGTFQIAGENRIFLLLNEEDGTTLFVSPLDSEDGFPILEQWSSIELLNSSPDGAQILIAGREDERDDTTFWLLPLVEKASPIELDDDSEGVRNAVFAPDGKSAIYTVETGSDADEVEIRQVGLDGESKYEALYEETYLVDVQWDILYPFEFSPYWLDVVTGTSFCPGAPTLITGDAQGQWEEELCYRVRLEADQAYTITVESNLDTRLDLYDRDGLVIDGDDDGGPGLNPRLFITVDTTDTYFLKVGAPAGDTGRFTLTLAEGYGAEEYDNPTMLTPGESMRDAITADSDQVTMPDGSPYGNIYAFEGSAGDLVTIDVLAPSINSRLDPKVFVLSSSLEQLGYDDDGGTGYDSQLVLTLPDDGTYYVLVGSVGDQYGSADGFFYEVLLRID